MKRTSIRTVGRRVRHVIALWQARIDERHCLAQMGHRDLRDIGLSPGEAFAEARKPFWIA
ncbi:DUF1127 domain-containing protein [Roseomonas sp. AR75]|jgi:uncharacterized protein YjiS (DUF1127 family)|uniref:DUF1127 domain-containing protein n=1 Tax=Roseomonas sp. AR75 TaxID=2562311 RepID=UPI0010C10CC4|nr:DUF1127 domain-containing protein [Roseomonas sp. AR75]